MTHDPARPPGASGTDDLQFDRAEAVAPPPPPPGGAGTATLPAAPAVAPGASVCAACNQPITDVYFEANGKVVCPQCHHAIMTSQAGGSAFGRLARAGAFGIGAGLAGSLIWFAVGHFFNIQSGLIAVLIGFMVGGAVRAGSRGRGGVGYQLMAVLLTYLSVGLAFVPGELSASPEPLSPLATAIVVVMTMVIGPAFYAFRSILTAIIIGFALWEAWKINTRQQVTFNGPYRLAPGGVPGSSVMPGMPSPTAPPPMPAWAGAAPSVPASAAQMASQQSAPPPPPPNLGL